MELGNSQDRGFARPNLIYCFSELYESNNFRDRIGRRSDNEV